MEDTLSRITAAYDALTDSEKKAADYVFSHPQEIISRSVHDFSAHIGISDATTVRFCRHLGFEGYRDFCLHMAQSITGHDDFVLDLSPDSGSLHSQVNQVLQANMEAIRSTMENLDEHTLLLAATKIMSARSVLLVGMATSGVVCQDAALRFLRMGLCAMYYPDYHAVPAALGHMDASDVVIGISHSGTTREVCSSLQYAKKRGCTVIGITTCPEQPIRKWCDILLRTCTRESPLHKVAITSRTSQLAVVDSLFVACMLLDTEKNRAALLEASEAIDRLSGKEST